MLTRCLYILEKKKNFMKKIKVVQVTFRCFLFANIVFIHIY